MGTNRNEEGKFDNAVGGDVAEVVGVDLGWRICDLEEKGMHLRMRRAYGDAMIEYRLGLGLVDSATLWVTVHCPKKFDGIMVRHEIDSALLLSLSYNDAEGLVMYGTGDDREMNRQQYAVDG